MAISPELYKAFGIRPPTEAAASSTGAGAAEPAHDTPNEASAVPPPPGKKPSRLTYALAYARYGMRIFPCHHIESDRECSCGKLKCSSAGKHPRDKGWQAEATTDEATIKRWWSENPLANIGIACGKAANLTVLDVDGDQGRDTLRELELQYGELPETPLAITGSGGYHYYFAYEPGLSNAVRFAPGLDVRTDGGLVIGVGSKTKDEYRWEAIAPLSSTLRPAKMPQWLAEKINSQNGKGGNGKVLVPETPLGAGQGRNNLLYKIGRSNKAQGFPRAAIEATIRSLNATFLPPLEEQELRGLINQVCTEPDRPGFLPAVYGNGQAPALPLVIPWENYALAVTANEAYLSRAPVIEKLCYSSAVSMITGGKHAGKSTLARWMAMCVVKGIAFLKRPVIQGPVVYVASEDETMPARQELLRLGWTMDDPLRFFSASGAPTDDRVKLLEALSRDIKANEVSLVVLDMLFDFVDIHDEMSYSGTREAVGRIQKVASETNAHIVVIHHAPKNAAIGDAAVAALGSQGLAARVSPIILVRRFGPNVHSIVSTTVRDPRGEAVAESRLVRHEDGSVSLGGVWKDYMLAEAYSERVVDFIQGEDGAEVTAPDVADGLMIPYQVARACLSMLWKNGALTRLGEGRKGKPYRYSVPKSNTVQNTVHGVTMYGISEPESGRLPYKD